MRLPVKMQGQLAGCAFVCHQPSLTNNNVVWGEGCCEISRELGLIETIGKWKDRD